MEGKIENERKLGKSREKVFVGLFKNSEEWYLVSCKDSERSYVLERK